MRVLLRVRICVCVCRCVFVLLSAPRYLYMVECVFVCVYMYLASPVAQTVKCLSAVQETRVQSLDREDPLEKEMVTHSSILSWEIPWTEKPGKLQSTGSQRVGHD